MLAGRQPEIRAETDRKLEEARRQRQIRRQKGSRERTKSPLSEQFRAAVKWTTSGLPAIRPLSASNSNDSALKIRTEAIAVICPPALFAAAKPHRVQYVKSLIKFHPA
jgi:hypothetical protein